MRRELSAVAPEAIALLHASAVLGTGWHDLSVVAEVAGAAGTTTTVEVLESAGLIECRASDPGFPLRPSHAMIRAAVYQTLPETERRELHRRAADVADTPGAALEHRILATVGFDEALADELSDASAVAYSDAQYRHAAFLLRSASALTRAPAVRSARYLDSLYISLTARDLAPVRAACADADADARPMGADAVREAIVRGALAIADKDSERAKDLLVVTESAADGHDEPLIRYRHAVLDLRARIGVGDGVVDLLPFVQRADAEGVIDAGLESSYRADAGQVALRLGRAETVLSAVEAVPDVPAQATIDQTFLMAWRSVIFAYLGAAGEAAAGLSEVCARTRRGVVSSTSDGVYEALLGLARWQAGAWDLAAVDIRLSLETRLAATHPVALAVAPFPAAGRGDWDAADQQLSQARDLLRRMPWPEVIRLYASARVVVAHGRKNSAEQRDLLAGLDADFGSTFLHPTGYVGDFILLHIVQAAIWAGDFDRAHLFLDAMHRGPYFPDWVRWGRPWLSGLLREAEGDLDGAVADLARAAAVPSRDLPLYRAHSLHDLGRLAQLSGDSSRATWAQQTAEGAYRRLGAVAYLSPGSSRGTGEAAPRLDRGPFEPLSTRERDIATLTVSGLSYAQMARELFLSVSTIRFHLTNVYAKTGVSGRHELSDLARQHGFGSPLGLVG